MPRLTTTERAFELARSGKHRTVTDLERALTSEGFESVHSSLYGETIRKQLRQLMAEARTRPES